MIPIQYLNSFFRYAKETFYIEFNYFWSCRCWFIFTRLHIPWVTNYSIRFNKFVKEWCQGDVSLPHKIAIVINGSKNHIAVTLVDCQQTTFSISKSMNEILRDIFLIQKSTFVFRTDSFLTLIQEFKLDKWMVFLYWL